MLNKYDDEVKSNIASLLGKRCRFEMMKKQSKNNNIIVMQLENIMEIPKNLIREELEMKYQGITIHKNKTCDTWYTRFRVGGKQYYISARTQKDCLEKLKKELYKKQREYFMSKSEENRNKSTTLLEWYNKWLELYKVGKVKRATLASYKSLINFIDNNLLNKSMSDIKVSEIIESLNACNKERQRQKLYELYQMLFQKAEDNDIVHKNIIRLVDKPKHEKSHGQALSNIEQKQLIETCQKVPNSEMLLVAMYQGLRRGELLGLTRDNIDFENNTLTINKSYNQYNKFDTTKNKQSERTMPLFENTRKLLLRYKNINANERIFKIQIKEYQQLVTKIKKHSKIEELKTKDMRSTFITRCQELNIPEYVIQSWVGHKIGSKVTKEVYTKYNAEDNIKYIDILNGSKFYSNSTHFLLGNKNDLR